MKIEDGEIYISEKDIISERRKLNQELKKGLLFLQMKYKIRAWYYNRMLSLKIGLENQKNRNNNLFENSSENILDDNIRER